MLAYTCKILMLAVVRVIDEMAKDFTTQFLDKHEDWLV